MMEKILIKYSSKELVRIEKLTIGDWIDLRAAADVYIPAGETRTIPLGVAMKLPEGYEAYVVPRSSTFKNFGLMLSNHFGVIDNSYCGDNDWWFFSGLAWKDTMVHKNDRICQFRIMEKQPEIEFIEVEELHNVSRGGFGSTGIQ